jgi:polar amino acid transport system substrate-binding protein
VSPGPVVDTTHRPSTGRIEHETEGHTMKKLLATLLLVPTLALAEAPCTSLVITGHPVYMPVAWADDGAKPELVSTIARSLGVKTVTSKDFGSWDKAQAATRDGQADVIFGIYKNDARAAWLDYLEPAFMMDPVVVVVRRGEGFAFSAWDDLKGKKGITSVGESFGDRFDGFMTKSLTVARAPSVEAAFKALAGKQADYLVIGLYPGRLAAKQYGFDGKMEFLAKEIDSFGMYVGFSRKSKCGALKAGFAEALRKEVAAGRVAPLLEAAHTRAEQVR